MYDCHVELLEVDNVPMSRSNERPNLFVMVQLLHGAAPLLDSHVPRNNNHAPVNDAPPAAKGGEKMGPTVPTYRTPIVTSATRTLNLHSSFIMNDCKEKGILLVKIFDQLESSEGLLGQFQIPIGGPGRMFGCRKMSCESLQVDSGSGNVVRNAANHTLALGANGQQEVKTISVAVQPSLPNAVPTPMMTVQVVWRVAKSNFMCNLERKLEKDPYSASTITLSPVVMHHLVHYTHTNLDANSGSHLHTIKEATKEKESDMSINTSIVASLPPSSAEVPFPAPGAFGVKPLASFPQPPNYAIGHSTIGCTQYLPVSPDGGKTQRELTLEQQISALRAELTLSGGHAPLAASAAPVGGVNLQNAEKCHLASPVEVPIVKDDGVICSIAGCVSALTNNTPPRLHWPLHRSVAPMKVDIGDKELSCIGKCENLQKILFSPCKPTLVEEMHIMTNNGSSLWPYQQSSNLSLVSSAIARVPDIHPHHGHSLEAAAVFSGDPLSINMTPTTTLHSSSVSMAPLSFAGPISVAGTAGRKSAAVHHTHNSKKLRC